MSAYCANHTGSDAYWYQNRNTLEAIFEQKKSAPVFFTFSMADNHWQDLHVLMPDKYDNQNIQFDKNKNFKNVVNNPHLVDWYFSWRLNEFLKFFFDDILDCDWR